MDGSIRSVLIPLNIEPMRRIYLISAICSLISLSSRGQAPIKSLNLYGKTFELSLSDSSENTVGRIPIEVFHGDSLLSTYSSSLKGKYNCVLEFGRKYNVVYGGGKYFQKSIEIDLTKVNTKTQKKGYRLEIDMTLFESDNNQVFGFLRELPIAKASFNKKGDMIIFEEKHTEDMYNKLNKAIASTRD